MLQTIFFKVNILLGRLILRN